MAPTFWNGVLLLEKYAAELVAIDDGGVKDAALPALYPQLVTKQSCPAKNIRFSE